MSPLVHIVDDDAQVRASTSYLLAAHGFATEIYASGEEFLDQARLDRGCVLLDLRMPGLTGHEVQRALARTGSALPVVVMSAHDDLPAAVEAMKLGAVDFLQKPPGEGALVDAVTRALEAFSKGEDRRAARTAAAARLQRLSPRELQILRGLLAGLSNKAIARHLGLSPRTVEMHRANMMSDLGLQTLPEALRLAIDAELAPLEDGEGSGPPLVCAPPETPPGPAQGERPFYDDTLRLVLEASADGAWDWDMRSGRMVLSESLVDRLGYVPEAVPDRLESYERVIHPEDRANFRRRIEDHFEGRTENYACTYRIRTRDGSWLWTDVRGRIVERDPATGAPLRMVGTATDITRQREDEEKARANATLLALAQWGAGAGTWDFEIDTGKLRLCPISREMHGLKRDGPLAMGDWSSTVHPDDLPRAFEALEEAIGNGGIYRAEFRVVRGGDTRWILGTGRLVEEGEGSPRRIVGLNQDITDSKRAAQAMQRAQQQLIGASRLSAMGTIARTLAHELAQPLTAVSHFSRGIAQRLSGSPAMDDPKLREALAGAEHSAALAADIVSRIRRRVVFGEPEREPVSLSGLVRDAVSLALIDADGQGIRHALDLDPNADAANLDPVQIQQLLLNLVRNAAEALVEVPVTGRRLRVSTCRSGGEIELRVADSGPGVADEMRERLFTPFASGKSDGMGIGLSICRTIAEAHGGRIWLETSEEGGAVFCVTLAG